MPQPFLEKMHLLKNASLKLRLLKIFTLFIHDISASSLSLKLDWCLKIQPANPSNQCRKQPDCHNFTGWANMTGPTWRLSWIRDATWDSKSSSCRSKKYLTKPGGSMLPMVAMGSHKDRGWESSGCVFQGIVGCTPTNVPLWEIPI